MSYLGGGCCFQSDLLFPPSLSIVQIYACMNGFAYYIFWTYAWNKCALLSHGVQLQVSPLKTLTTHWDPLSCASKSLHSFILNVSSITTKHCLHDWCPLETIEKQHLIIHLGCLGHKWRLHVRAANWFLRHEWPHESFACQIKLFAVADSSVH